MRKRTFWFHKLRGISSLTEDLLASHEGLCYMDLVNVPNRACFRSGSVSPCFDSLRYTILFAYC
jgi:hypothetical protein